ncbi:MAG: hypothetical protein C5B56_12135, partial [Proteobacteria bacterium]
EPRPPRRLNDQIPRDLETVCLKAMAKEPGRRYQTAGAFADDLRRYLGGEPVKARPVGRIERAARWAKRRPATAALLAVSIAAVLTVLGLSLWYNTRLNAALYETEQERDRADRNYRIVKAEREHADKNFQQALEAVKQMLTEVAEGDLANAPYMEPVRRRLLERALGFFEQFSQYKTGDAALRLETAWAQERVGNILERLGRLAEADRAFESARTLADELLADAPQDPNYRHLRFVIGNQLGILRDRAGRYAEAEKLFAEAIAGFERLANQFPDNVTYVGNLGTSYINMAKLVQATGRFAEAEKPLAKALEIDEKLADAYPGGEDPLRVFASTLHSFGVLQDRLHRPEQAEKAFRRSIEVLEKRVKESSERPEWLHLLAQNYHSLAIVLEERREFDDAKEAFAQALKYKKALAADFPRVHDYQSDLANTHNGIGVVHRNLGEFAEAEASFREALAIQEKLAAERSDSFDLPLSMAGSCCNIGHALSGQGKLEPSLPWYARSIKTLNELLGNEPRHATTKLYLRNAYQGRARVFLALGRFPESVADWDKAVEFDPGPFRPAYRSSRAHALAGAGNFGRALAEADELRSAPDLPGQSTFEIACVYSLAADALEKGKFKPPAADRTPDRCVADAIEVLKLAVRRKYRPLDRFEQDPALNPLRSHAEFQALLAELKADGQK